MPPRANLHHVHVSVDCTVFGLICLKTPLVPKFPKNPWNEDAPTNLHVARTCSKAKVLWCRPWPTWAWKLQMPAWHSWTFSRQSPTPPRRRRLWHCSKLCLSSWDGSWSTLRLGNEYRAHGLRAQHVNCSVLTGCDADCPSTVCTSFWSAPCNLRHPYCRRTR